MDIRRDLMSMLDDLASSLVGEEWLLDRAQGQ
jgi:hypothetical protein